MLAISCVCVLYAEYWKNQETVKIIILASSFRLIEAADGI